MMYNRYVPDAAGVYRPTRVEDVPPPPPVQPPAPPPVPEAPPEPPAPCPPLPVRQDAGGGLFPAGSGQKHLQKSGAAVGERHFHRCAVL